LANISSGKEFIAEFLALKSFNSEDSTDEYNNNRSQHEDDSFKRNEIDFNRKLD